MELGRLMLSGRPTPVLHMDYGEISNTWEHEAGYGLGLLSVLDQATSTSGRAGDVDPDFAMLLDGSVRDTKGIDMSLHAGRLSVKGKVHVSELDNQVWQGVRGLGTQQMGSVSGVFSQEDGSVLQSQLTPDGLTSFIKAASGRAHGLFL
ncbi:MAG: hypothetical protein II132_06255 [Desulfovibrio sp.]|nr:hypothetical protein [Desulfovibrio sp.]